MPTEAKRGLVRIGSNYSRLLCNLVFGVLLVPLLGGWLGADALGLFLFLIAQAGLAAIFNDVMRTSLIRELGAAWHGDGDFEQRAAAASVVCLGTAVLAVGAFAALWAIMPLLNIPGDGLMPAARWMLVFEGVFTIINILLAPAFNMYIVREFFVAQNLFVALDRVGFLLSVIVCRIVYPDIDVPTGLLIFVGGAVSWRIVVLCIGAGIMMARDRRVIPRPWRGTRESIHAILGTYGWNTGTILATNLHDRAGAFIMNIFFGLWGNLVYGLAQRLVFYIRMITTGMTSGLDAVGARLATNDVDGASLKSMVRNATRLHAMIAAPAAIGAVVLADPLLRLWLGRSLDKPDDFIPMAAMLVQIMAIGLAARAIADGWQFLLYGAGHIRRYARIILLGGAVDLVLGVSLAMLLPKLGREDIVPWTAAAGPAWAVTLSFLVFHGILLPLRGARILGVRRRVFVRPLLGPALLAVVCAPALLVPMLYSVSPGEAWTLIDLAVGAGAYGLLYFSLASRLLISADERRRIRGVLQRLSGLAR